MTRSARPASGRCRQGLDARGEEQRVGGSAPVGATGRIGHRGRRCVDADDQSRRFCCSAGEHDAAVTRADIHDHPVGPGDQAGDLADVHLEGAPADDLSHGGAVYTRPVNPPIGPYVRLPPTVEPWDPRTIEVAAAVTELIRERRPDLTVEHIGSTAVPGLPGKGIVDLAIATTPDDVPVVAALLRELGFGPQPGPDPWPPSRPMLVGSMVRAGTTFRIHLHVLPDREELNRDLAFRDALLADPALVEGYATLKTGIVAGGPLDATPSTRTASRRGSPTSIAGSASSATRSCRPARSASWAVASSAGCSRSPRGRWATGSPCSTRTRPVQRRPSPIGWWSPATTTWAERSAWRSSATSSPTSSSTSPSRSSTRSTRCDRSVPGVCRSTSRRTGSPSVVSSRRPGQRSRPWREVRDTDGLRAAADELGLPLRLKVATGGYDGRGQLRLTDPSELDDALQRLGGPAGESLLAETELAFQAELSIVVARSTFGGIATYPLACNRHDAGILVESVAPASVDRDVAERAVSLGERLAVTIGVTGTLTVELFLMPDGRLVVNELAPRVHNSGHWTIEGAATSQFEQHIRAICGLDLGSTEALGTRPWSTCSARDAPGRRGSSGLGLARAMADPAVHLHLYDKRQVFERRKMGHVTAMGATTDDALSRARAAVELLRWRDDDDADPADAERDDATSADEQP